MSEPSIEIQKRQNRTSQKSRIVKDRYLSLCGHLNDVKERGFLAGETPFQPPIMTHLEMILGATSVEEKNRVMSYLQQSYGNKYIQSLVETIKAQTSTSTIKTNIQRQPEEEEEEIPSPPVEQEEALKTPTAAFVTAQAPTHFSTSNAKQKKYGHPQPVNPKYNPPPIMTPPAGGACVIVRNRAFAVWINPNSPECAIGGLIAHEDTHIRDLMADPNYNTIPTSGTVPDGDMIHYRNDDDARIYEHAACDVEMEWIRGELAGELAPADRAILEYRLNVTLPAYRASFG